MAVHIRAVANTRRVLRLALKGEMDREQAWKLGEDLHTEDSLLDGLTFADLILTVHCNCRDITPSAVRKELMEILASRKQDMFYLLEMNMDVIMAEARKGRA